jgi:hypothetical protein
VAGVRAFLSAAPRVAGTLDPEIFEQKSVITRRKRASASQAANWMVVRFRWRLQPDNFVNRPAGRADKAEDRRVRHMRLMITSASAPSLCANVVWRSVLAVSSVAVPIHHPARSCDRQALCSFGHQVCAHGFGHGSRVPGNGRRGTTRLVTTRPMSARLHDSRWGCARYGQGGQMDEDRRIRLRIPPILFVASLLLGALLDLRPSGME